MRKLFKIQLICLFLILFWRCESELDKYYARPDWLKGNALELMEERGNFTHFIKALEKADYKNMVNGRELCTVMAPNDEAFEKYFARHGYSSVDDIPLEVLEVLVPYHILQNAFEEDYMLAFTKDSDPTLPGDGTRFKFETYAHAPIYQIISPIDGRNKQIYGRTKYMPIISSTLFKTRNIDDPEASYRFFFPDINWQGNERKLHTANAAIIEASIPTDNGYLYVLDDISEELRTLHEALEAPKQNDFSTFLSLYDKFVEFPQAEIVGGDTLFHFRHYTLSNKAKSLTHTDELPSIGSEWSYHGELTNRDDYEFYRDCCYNCFAPTNAALDAFFENYCEGFQRIQDLPQLSLYYLFRNVVKEQAKIILPEEIQKNGIRGELGEKWDITLNDIVTREFCANGILYGLNQMLVPSLFDLVTKPLLTTPDYSIMANMLFKIDQYNILADPAADRFTLFIIADTTLENLYGYTMDYGSDIFNDTDEAVKLNGTKVSDNNLMTFVDTHIAEEAVRDFSQRSFYATKNAFTYIYTESGYLYDESGSRLEILKSWETENGPTYEISAQLNKSSLSVMNFLTLTSDYTDFLELLKTAGLVNASNQFVNIEEEERMILFAPKNGTYDRTTLDAMDPADLAELLSYHFILINENGMNEYILPNLGQEREYSTMAEDPDNSTPYKTEYYKLDISYFNNQKLKLTNTVGTIYYTDGSIPVFATNGLIYPMDGILQIK